MIDDKMLLGNPKDESYVMGNVLVSVSHNISLPLMHKWEDMAVSFRLALLTLSLKYSAEWVHCHAI